MLHIPIHCLAVRRSRKERSVHATVSRAGADVPVMATAGRTDQMAAAGAGVTIGIRIKRFGVRAGQLMPDKQSFQTGYSGVQSLRQSE